MGTNQHQQLPPGLERGRSRFQAWRGRRKPGSRIPQPLWVMATRLAKVHGVSHTSALLGLDYYRLKPRVELASSEPPSSGPAFVELTKPVLVAQQCRFALDNGAGVTMRVHLAGYDAVEIEFLSRGFWNAP